MATRERDGATRGRALVGVDVGGTKIAAGIVGPDLRLLTSRRISTPRERDALLAAIEGIVSDLAGQVPLVEIAAVGVGLPGVVDRTGRVLWANHVDLEGVGVRDELEARLGMPVATENDGEMAALAEATVGAAQADASSVTLTLGTGIGGGAVIRGALLLGGTGGPELGHVVVDAEGPPCPGRCPNRGCVEAWASGTAIAREAQAAARRDAGGSLARAASDGPLTARAVAELAAGGDACCIGILARAGRFLGVALASLANLLSPEVFVIGGGVSAAGELVIGPARDEYRARAIPPSANARVVPASLGPDAGMLGAALAARQVAG